MRILTISMLTIGALGCAPSPAPTPRGMAPSGPPPPLSTVLEWEAASRGRAIALAGCASCHAIDREGSSAHPMAPPFREIVRTRSLDTVEADMAQGLVTTHPDMPPYTFRASEIDDLVAYLETLRGADGR